ncbi:acylphosphatase [Natronospira bacteriovora]|uniref:acylphosphatase n=1 Tax=Natronospira bacteriovora TaxID=3069753 RepID=A0ABU0W619_9GAMM|nr:acylphosphatase [Natronospira sp. AB-CW4]MDQ2069441.1 acylphosphatase [Natronospira sp. AB-CW4]
MSRTITRRCLVSGRVQGVFYRASTKKEARALGVSGWARNLPDGRVEVVASGPAESVDALCEWLWEGSPSSSVEDVVCRDYEGEVEEGFRTR